MRFAINVLAASLALALGSNAWAQGTGRSLDIQPGGRQNGMGAAGVALADDPTGVTWWNPAGLGFVGRTGVELSYAQLVPGLADDVSYSYLTFVQPLKGWGAYGVGIVFLSYGQSEGANDQGTSTGFFSSNEFSPQVYFGTQILPELSVGAALKFIRIQLAPSDQSGVGSTFGVDLAALYRLQAAHLNMGVNVQNLGPEVSFLSDDRTDPLSRNVKVGLAWEPYSSTTWNVTTAADFNQSLVTNDFRTYHGGVEVGYSEHVALRLGYYYDPLGQIGNNILKKFVDGNSLTYGLGFNFKGFTIDLGSIPQAKDSDLGNVQKFTIGYRF